MFLKPASAAPRMPLMPLGFAFIMWHAPGLAGAAAAGAATHATATTADANKSTIRLRIITASLRRFVQGE